MAAMIGSALIITACDGGTSGKSIEAQTLKVACGSCVFEMKDVDGCPWAAEVEGKYYLMQGAVPQNHDSHADDGMCNMPREAVVSGTLRDDKLIVTSMKLKPAREVPSAQTFTEKDIHK